MIATKHGYCLAGKAIKDREKVILVSKWGPMSDDKGNYSLDGSAQYVRKSLQLSLKNLGVDYIDLYILRSKDPESRLRTASRAWQ